MISLSHTDVENHHRPVQHKRISITQHSTTTTRHVTTKLIKPSPLTLTTDRIALMNVTNSQQNDMVAGAKRSQRQATQSVTDSHPVYNDHVDSQIQKLNGPAKHVGKRKDSPVVLHEHNTISDSMLRQTKQTSLFDYISVDTHTGNNENGDVDMLHADNDDTVSLMSEVSEVDGNTYVDGDGNTFEMTDYMRATLRRKKQRAAYPTWMHYDNDAGMQYQPTMLQRYFDLEQPGIYGIQSGYMTATQKELNYAMRCILMDWMVEVSEEYNLHQNTLFLTISHIDRFLSMVEVQRSKLQLLGMGCCLIAAKYWEIYPPSIDDFVYISDNTYTKQQVLRMESVLLQTFRFNMTTVTCWDFRTSFYKANRSNVECEHVCDYMLESATHEELYVTYQPSIVMASIVYYVNHLYGQELMPAKLKRACRHEESELMPCIQAIYDMHGKISATDHKLRAVHDKYKTDAKHCASQRFKPKSLTEQTATPQPSQQSATERIKSFATLLSSVLLERRLDDEAISTLLVLINLKAARTGVEAFERIECDSALELLSKRNIIMLANGRVYKI